MSSGLIRFAVAGFLAVTAAVACHAAFAQQAPATPSAPAPAAPSPTPLGLPYRDCVPRSAFETAARRVLEGDDETATLQSA